MSGKKLNIVFFGEDSFSGVILNSLIQAEHRVKLVVTPYYDNLIYKKLEYICIEHQIEFARCKKINSEETCKLVEKAQPDLCVISHFERLIKQPLLGIPRMGFVNLHPSLLPKYRGMSPQHWPIINGDKEAGITIHYVDEGTDTGSIILQKRFPLQGNEYVRDLQKIWMKHYQTVMVEAIDKIIAGEPAISQEGMTGSYYGRLTDDDCQIAPNGTAQQAYNLVRGVGLPYHGAQLGNIIIWKAHLDVNVKVANTHNGVHLDTIDGDYIVFNDGILFIDKYQKI